MKSELVTTLKRQATRILADLHESKDPVLITEHGVPSAYLVDVSVFEWRQDHWLISRLIPRARSALAAEECRSPRVLKICQCTEFLSASVGSFRMLAETMATESGDMAMVSSLPAPSPTA